MIGKKQLDETTESIELILNKQSKQLIANDVDDGHVDDGHVEDGHVDHDAKQEKEGECCFLYDYTTKPTCIEKLFGETDHVKDEYASHRITISFVLTLIAVYMVEGCIDWMLIAIRYYGASIHNMGPDEMTNFTNIIFWPWNIKIIYGLITDGLPLFGYKRKSYLLIFGILAAISMLLVIIYSETLHLKMIFMTINQLSVCFCDVIADALTIERTEFKSHTVATRLQALAWGSRSVAVTVGSLISTAMFEKYGRSPYDWIYVYWAYFAICIPICICSIFIPETRHKKYVNIATEESGTELRNSSSPDYSIKEILCITYDTLCRKAIFYPILFVFILNFTPTADEGIVYFLIYKLGFQQTEIGYMSVALQIAFLISIGIITYQSRKSNSDFSLRKLFLIWTLIAAILPFITLILIFRINLDIGIPDLWFLISDRIIIRISTYMLLMGTLVLTARLCPPGIEGVFMTVLTSIMNIGSTISMAISAAMIDGLNIECIEDPNDINNLVCNFNNLWILIIIVNITTLIPLILIKKVPNEKDLQRISEKLKQSQDLDNKVALNKSEMIKLYWLCKCNKQQQEKTEQENE